MSLNFASAGNAQTDIAICIPSIETGCMCGCINTTLQPYGQIGSQPPTPGRGEGSLYISERVAHWLLKSAAARARRGRARIGIVDWCSCNPPAIQEATEVLNAVVGVGSIIDGPCTPETFCN